VGERELCVGKLDEGERYRGRMGEGRGARGARAKAGSRVKIPQHAQPLIGIKAQNEI
jgi:hypothetical protein